MAYQMIVTLTDQEYQKLTAEATRGGKQPETLLHNLIQHLPSSPEKTYAMTGREGKLLTLATKRPLTQEELEERERLAQQLGKGGKPASEMLIEDRGL